MSQQAYFFLIEEQGHIDGTVKSIDYRRLLSQVEG